MKNNRLYEVTTYDMELEEFTPQEGLPPGPYTWGRLRAALRLLREMGYACTRQDTFVLVEQLP